MSENIIIFFFFVKIMKKGIVTENVSAQWADSEKMGTWLEPWVSSINMQNISGNISKLKKQTI